ncbi:metal ABC transporter substrate-binding protein, partial [Escherichia coli]|nr:metal ABC transporter substrate-binding protein [Escherichia coli]
MKRSILVVALSSLLVSPLVIAKELNVVASFSVLGDMVSQIGGPYVHVTDLV